MDDDISDPYAKMDSRIKASIQWSQQFEAMKWVVEIPFIQFKPEWEVKVIPPFIFTVVRFQVKKKNSDKIISVYLDCYDLAGYEGQPYWELHPNWEGDCDRFYMNHVEELLKGIEKALG